MRKLFRFKYEPCNGTCYAWCDVLIRELRKINPVERDALVKRMVTAHNHLCDNPQYSFGVDVDEDNKMFVAHLRTPDKTDLYSSDNFETCVTTICENVLSSDIPKIKGECNFGDNGAEDLGREILKYCEDVALLNARHCECKAHAS